MTPTDWPPHTSETVPWKQTFRQGPAADRMLDEVTVMLPPLVAGTTIDLAGELLALLEQATREITRLDSAHAGELTALSGLLLRTESVASSKIERIEADVRDYARALHGNRSNAAALAMADATVALAEMVEAVGPTRPLAIETVLTAHRALMTNDAEERAHAGRLREVQNWIGGSDHSPRGALYVPPPPRAVDAYMDDLVTFANRADLPALALAALAHAQFESIHPFTDGNGRIGRALVNAILRHRGVTEHVVVPIASALVAQREQYFAFLADYRAGHAAPIIEAFARAALIAAGEARTTATRLTDIPVHWRSRLGQIRGASATDVILTSLPSQPVITAADAERLTGAPTSAVYTALNRLAAAGILVPLTDRKRHQIWGAIEIFDELDDLNHRIGERSRQPR